MKAISLELVPESGVDRPDPAAATTYEITAHRPEFLLRGSSVLELGLYRLTIVTPDAAFFEDASVVLADCSPGSERMPVRLSLERTADRLHAYFTMPPGCGTLRFAPVLSAETVRIGEATLKRMSTTRRRLARAASVLGGRARSPKRLAADFSLAGQILRREGWPGLRRTLGEMLIPSRIIHSQPTMEMRLFSRQVAQRNREDLAAATASAPPETGASLSVVVPVYHPPVAWLEGLIASFTAQSDPDFELVLVFDGPQPELAQAAEAACEGLARKTIVTLEENRGVSAATNAGIRQASGDYVVVIDHDDRVDPSFVAAFRYASRALPADIYFADEAITDAEMKTVRAIATRPRFDIRYYLSHPYIVHPIFIRRRVALSAGLLDETMSISHDVDFALRCIARSHNVVQIPMVLYYWRTHETSLGHAKAEQVSTNTRGAIRRYLEATMDWQSFEVRDGENFNEYDVRPPVPEAKVAIVIPTKNRKELLSACLASLQERAAQNRTAADIVVIDHESDDADTVAFLKAEAEAGRITVLSHEGPWNFSAINNAAVAALKARGAYSHLVFMNNDIELVTADWLDRLLSQFAYPDVGIVGCCLQYPDGRVQHAGVVVGLVGPADHAHRFEPMFALATGRRHPSHLASLVSTRDYSAVTAALMVVKADLFEAVGGFDEKLGVGFNDTDLCLRIGALGYRSTYVGSVVATHHESVTRGGSPHIEDTALFLERYGAIVRDGDECYGLMMDWSQTIATTTLDRQKAFALRETRLLGRRSHDNSPNAAADRQVTL